MDKRQKIREKQKEANRTMREAKKHLKEDHRAIKQAKERKRLFYTNRGLKNRGMLSDKDIEVKDLEAYEALLDSIIESTYLNKEKYEKYKTRQENWAKEKGFAKTDEEAQSLFELLNSEIIQELIDLGVKPSDIMVYLFSIEDEYSVEDFIQMAKDFMLELSLGRESKLAGGYDLSINEFFNYADNWTRGYSEALHAEVDDEGL